MYDYDYVLSCDTKQLISSESRSWITFSSDWLRLEHEQVPLKLVDLISHTNEDIEKKVFPIGARTLFWSDEWVLFLEEFQKCAWKHEASISPACWKIKCTKKCISPAHWKIKCTKKCEASKILKNTSYEMQFQNAKKMHLDYQISHIPRPPGMPKSDL